MFSLYSKQLLIHDKKYLLKVSSSEIMHKHDFVNFKIIYILSPLIKESESWCKNCSVVLKCYSE